MTGTLGRFTMYPPVSNTVAGDLTTTWRRFAAVTILRLAAVATHLRELTGLRLLPTRCHLFRRSRVLVAHDRIDVTPERSVCPKLYVGFLDVPVKRLGIRPFTHFRLFGSRAYRTIRVFTTTI
ncbi:MAG: hypothetical protein L7F78_15765 [Syntrophales bacterium LBB04]|nr:hypothetical protein [Syntrophales bacterium LBB04]